MAVKSPSIYAELLLQISFFHPTTLNCTRFYIQDQLKSNNILTIYVSVDWFTESEQETIVRVDKKAYIERSLSVLSKQEVQQAEDLFEFLFFFDPLAYSLFGTKPMSIAALRSQKDMELGWDAWKKIAPFFSSETFVVREHVFNGQKFVVVANLENVERTYLQHKELFDRSFGGRMTVDALKLCLREEGPLFQELMRDDLILGLLLGFGARNAQLFFENQRLPQKERFALKPFDAVHPVFYYFSPVMPPHFACDLDSEETKELQHRYQKERVAIKRLARKENLFMRMLYYNRPRT